MLPEGPAASERSAGCARREPLCLPPMETPTNDQKPDDTPDQKPDHAPEGEPDERSAAPPTEPEEGGSYEDSWYQVLKRRAEDKPPADDQQSEK